MISAVLLAGLVTMNLAVLRLNIQLDHAAEERSRLRADTSALQADLSSALAAARIQSTARRELGLVDAGPAVYIDLGR